MNRPIRRDLYRYPGNSIQGREAVGGIGGKREGPSGPVCWLRRCCRLFRVKNLTLAAFGNAPLLLLTWRLRCPARRPSSSLAHQANQTRARSVWHTADTGGSRPQPAWRLADVRPGLGRPSRRCSAPWLAVPGQPVRRLHPRVRR